MALITRLVTFVDLDGDDGRRLSFAARHDALLADGRRIVLLDDRGWTQSRRSFFIGEHESPRPEQPSSPWEGVTREQIEETARSVVGPDSDGSYTQAEMDEGHWWYLSEVLEGYGIEVDGAVLKAVPHEVELSDRVLAQLAP